MLYEAYQPWVLAAGFVALAGGALALLYARQHAARPDRAGAGAWPASPPPSCCWPASSRSAGARRRQPAAGDPGRTQAPHTRIYSVGIYEQSLTFYLRRPVMLVDYTDEFTFGLQQQPELAIPTVDALRRPVARRRRRRPCATLAIIRADIVADLKQQGVPMRVVAADSRRIVIAND